MLYDLTFAQLLSLIECRNKRELKAQEAAEERAKAGDGSARPPQKDLLAEDNLPSVDDVMKCFGGF